MVCNRCKYVVQTEIEKSGQTIKNIQLGEIEIEETLNKSELISIGNRLEKFGFELIDDNRSKIIEKIKKLLIELTQPDNEKHSLKLSSYLSQHFSKEYNYLSNLFSETEGQTIEHYFISLKIEKVKELLKYNEFTLSEIAWKMGYTSVSHLSKQFKQITGLTPTHFKFKRNSQRTPLENL